MIQNEAIKEYDAKGRIIHYRDSDGLEFWYEYNSNGNCIHIRTSNGFEVWREYDANGNQIHYWDTCGNDNWYWEGERTEDPIAILILKKKIIDKVTQI